MTETAKGHGEEPRFRGWRCADLIGRQVTFYSPSWARDMTGTITSATPKQLRLDNGRLRVDSQTSITVHD